MPVPFFQVFADGSDITERLGSIKVSLTITDGVGMDADTLLLSIDDKDGLIAPPKTGVELRVIAGYEDWRVDFGIYTVDQVTLRGWPQTIDVSAQATKAKSEVKQRRCESYQPPDFNTYGDVFRAVAGRHDLQLSISADLAGKPLEFEAQAEEDDLGFLTRISGKLDAHVSIKSNRLVVVKRGKGESASGQKLPDIVIERGVNILDYVVNHKDKAKYSQVKTTYFDRQTGERKECVAPAGDEGPELLVREPYQSEQEAQDAADAKGREVKRAEADATFTIDGNPAARAEAHAIVRNVRSLVDGRWRATQVTHNWTSTEAYKTTVQCELPE